MRKLWIITTETYLRQIKSWSFVVLVLAPFVMLGLSLGIGYFSSTAGEDSDRIAVIADQPVRQQFIHQHKADVKTSVTTVAAAKKAVRAETITGYLILKSGPQQVTATYHGGQSLATDLKNKVDTFLMQQQQRLNLSNANLSTAQLQALQQEPRLKQIVHKNWQCQASASDLILDHGLYGLYDPDHLFFNHGIRNCLRKRHQDHGNYLFQYHGQQIFSG